MIEKYFDPLKRGHIFRFISIIKCRLMQANFFLKQEDVISGDIACKQFTLAKSCEKRLLSDREIRRMDATLSDNTRINQ